MVRRSFYRWRNSIWVHSPSFAVVLNALGARLRGHDMSAFFNNISIALSCCSPPFSNSFRFVHLSFFSLSSHRKVSTLIFSFFQKEKGRGYHLLASGRTIHTSSKLEQLRGEHKTM